MRRSEKVREMNNASTNRGVAPNAIYGAVTPARKLAREVGVVGFNRGVYEFDDGTYALDLAKKFPVSKPSGPMSLADAKRQLARMKTAPATSAPMTISQARHRLEAAKRR